MKRKTGKNCKARLGSSGQTIVIAAVLMLVFFILGIAVLSAAASSSSSQNQRRVNTQTYYYAAGMLDALDLSLREGELGDRLCLDALSQVDDTSTFFIVSGTQSAELSLGTESIGRLELSYTGEISTSDDGSSATISLTNIKVKPTAEHNNAEYSFTAEYKLATNAAMTLGQWSIGDKTCELLGLK